MRPLQNTTGSFGYDETPGEIGNFTTDLSRKEYQNLIAKANSVPLINVFKHYGLRLNEMNKKIICPFKAHKNGKESTPSFYYYPQTNTYYCFGCKIGNRPCDFVAEMDNISKFNAANKIIKIFNNEIDDTVILDEVDFNEKLNTIMSFSEVVREFHQKFSDEKSFLFIENICKIYDALNCKYKNLNNDALLSIINQLKEEISNYTP